MRELIGRESELTFLESLWNRSDSCACKVIGRRRIGKSELLRRFAEGKRSIYIECVEIGRWWGVDEEKEIREIDIAAKILIDGSVSALFGKCKFRTRKTTVDVLDELRKDCGLVRTDLRKMYILFSASGFTAELEEEAEENGVVLVDLEDLVRPMTS